MTHTDGATADVHACRPQPTPPVAGRGHVLVVEDNRINQMVAMRILEQLGYSVEVAADGVGALAALNTTPFAAVLMDCQMPRMDGYTATRRVRDGEGAGPHVPIIAMTASMSEDERERCLAAGMDDFVTKPVDQLGMARVLERWVSHRHPDQTPGVLDHRRIDMLRDLEPGDTSLLEGTVSSFLRNSPRTLERIQDAVAAGDPAELVAAAHQLKGSALNLGVPRLAAVSGELELLGDTAHLGPAPAAVSRLSAELDQALEALRRLRAGSYT